MELIDEGDSISECLIVYFVVLTSSVSGARNATFFAAGNRDRDCANDIVRVRMRGIGPLERIDVELVGSLYGISEGSESTVDTEVADAADEEVPSEVSAELGSLICEGDGADIEAVLMFVESGVSLCFAPGV